MPSITLLLASVVIVEGRLGLSDTKLLEDVVSSTEADGVDDVSPCERALSQKGATLEAASACCTLTIAGMPADKRPAAANDTGVWDQAEKLRSQGVCGGAPGSTDALVERLNSEYNSFDPWDASSSLGVAFHAADIPDSSELSEMWNMSCGSCLGGSSASDCFVSFSYLSQKVTAWADDWASKRSCPGRHCPGIQKDASTCVIGGGTLGGAVFSQEAVDVALKCSYAVNAYSLDRPGGCGCSVDTGVGDCVKSDKWECPKSKGCNKDPDTGGEITNSSRVLHACECQSVSQDPNGRDRNDDGAASCVWLGSSRTKAHQALVQQYNFRKTNMKCWNEFVMDGPLLNRIVKQSPTTTVLAFVMAWPHCVIDEYCRQIVRRSRDFLTREHTLKQLIPIVGFDIFNGSEPFRVLDASLS